MRRVTIEDLMDALKAEEEDWNRGQIEEKFHHTIDFVYGAHEWFSESRSLYEEAEVMKSIVDRINKAIGAE